MPPSAVKTIRDVIYWQYAKLISKSAGFGISSRAFQMERFKKLQSGGIKWSSTVREWLIEHEKPDECVYCKNKTDLTVEHILPKSCGGPDITDNTILVCKSCNSKKGGKRLYESFGLSKKDEIPRIAEGKYLKLLYDLHEKAGTLDVDIAVLDGEMCCRCAIKQNCVNESTVGKMTVYCLEGMFRG